MQTFTPPLGLVLLITILNLVYKIRELYFLFDIRSRYCTELSLFPAYHSFPLSLYFSLCTYPHSRAICVAQRHALLRSPRIAATMGLISPAEHGCDAAVTRSVHWHFRIGERESATGSRLTSIESSRSGRRSVYVRTRPVKLGRANNVPTVAISRRAIIHERAATRKRTTTSSRRARR